METFTISVLNRDHLFQEYQTGLNEDQMIKTRNEYLDKYKMHSYHLQADHAAVFIANGHIMTITCTQD